MNQLAKWILYSIILGLLTGTAFAAGGGGHSEGAPFPVPLSCYSADQGSKEFMDARCDKVDGIENYRDPEGAGMGEILSSRLSANAFNLIGSLIFLFAILHTFMANKLTAMAHQVFPSPELSPSVVEPYNGKHIPFQIFFQTFLM